MVIEKNLKEQQRKKEWKLSTTHHLFSVRRFLNRTLAPPSFPPVFLVVHFYFFFRFRTDFHLIKQGYLILIDVTRFQPFLLLLFIDSILWRSLCRFSQLPKSFLIKIRKETIFFFYWEVRYFLESMSILS